MLVANRLESRSRKKIILSVFLISVGIKRETVLVTGAKCSRKTADGEVQKDRNTTACLEEIKHEVIKTA